MAPSMMVMPMIAKTNLSMKIEELGKDDFEMGKMNMITTSGQPLDAIGGLAAPHLPAHHPYKQPTTNLEVGKW